MLLSGHLLEKLNSEELPLSDRLDFAKRCVVSSELLLSNKEDIILEWCGVLLNQNKKNASVICHILETISSIIQYADTIALPPGKVRSSTKSKLLHSVTKCLREKNLSDKSLLYILSLFQNNLLIHHFKRNGGDFVSLLNMVLIVVPPTEEYISNIISIVTDFSKLEQAELKVMLVNECLFEIINYISNFENPAEELRFTKCVQSIFFHKVSPEMMNLEFDCLFSENESDNISVMKTLIPWLVKSFQHEDCPPRLGYYIFKAFVLTFKKHRKLLCKFLVILSHVLGLQPLTFSSSKSPLMSPDKFNRIFEFKPELDIAVTGKSYIVLKSILIVINECSCNVSTTIDDIPFIEWLHGLILVMIDNKKEVNQVHLQALKELLLFHPTVSEISVDSVMSCLLLQEEKVYSEDFLNTYTEILNIYLESFNKLQRVHKFIAKFTSTLKNRIDPAPLASALLPPQFLKKFAEILRLLPNSQCLVILEILLGNFSLDNLNISELNTVWWQVVCSLISVFLENVRIFDHTTPKTLVESYDNFGVRFEEQLKEYGKSLLHLQHDQKYVYPYLCMCYVWGEVKILSQMYRRRDDVEITPPADSSPTNLSPLHGYLESTEWNAIAERIANFGIDKCKDLMLKLLRQKLKSYQVCKNFSEASIEATSKYLYVQLTSGIYKDFIRRMQPEEFHIVISMLTVDQSHEMTNTLIKSILPDTSVHSTWIKNKTLSEDKDFVFGVVSAVIKSINEQFNYADTSKVYQSCFKSLKRTCLSEDGSAKLSYIKNLCGSVNDLIDSITTNEERTFPELIDKKLLVNTLELLKMLPITYIGIDIQSIICAVVVIVMASTLNHPDDQIADDCLNIMVSIFESVNVSCSFIHFGLLVKFLVLACEKRPTCYTLIQKIVSAARKHEFSLEELVQCISFIRKRIKSANDEHALKIMTLLQRDFSKSMRKPEMNQLMMKYRKKISGRIMELLQSNSDNLESRKSLLDGYLVEFTRNCASNNPENILQICQLNFHEYFQLAYDTLSLDSSDALSIEFMTTVTRYYPKLRDHIGNDIFERIWKLSIEVPTIYPSMVTFLSGNSTDEEFQVIIKCLLNHTLESIKSEDQRKYLVKNLELWRLFLEEPSAKKIHTVQGLQVIFRSLISSINVLSVSPCLESIYSFFSVCISKPEVPMNSLILDAIFQYCTHCPLQEAKSLKEFEVLFSASITVLTQLLYQRTDCVLDRIGNLFQQFTRYLNELVKRSDMSHKLDSETIEHLLICSFLLEKFTNAMVKQKRDFQRISSYFIADIIGTFERFTIYPQVKTHMKNCINNMLSICDTHNILFLRRILSVSSQQIFNQLYREFQKYHQFTGKI